MLKSINIQGPNGELQTLVCLHWRTFPPVSALQPESVEEQRKNNTLSATDYQQHLVWARICGQIHMNKKKCRYCPQVRFLKQKGGLWVLEDKDGKMAVPIVDSTTLESLFRYKDPRIEAQKAPKIPGRTA